MRGADEVALDTDIRPVPERKHSAAHCLRLLGEGTAGTIEENLRDGKTFQAGEQFLGEEPPHFLLRLEERVHPARQPLRHGGTLVGHAPSRLGRAAISD